MLLKKDVKKIIRKYWKKYPYLSEWVMEAHEWFYIQLQLEKMADKGKIYLKNGVAVKNNPIPKMCATCSRWKRRNKQRGTCKLKIIQNHYMLEHMPLEYVYSISEKSETGTCGEWSYH